MGERKQLAGALQPWNDATGLVLGKFSFCCLPDLRTLPTFRLQAMSVCAAMFFLSILGDCLAGQMSSVSNEAQDWPDSLSPLPCSVYSDSTAFYELVEDQLLAKHDMCELTFQGDELGVESVNDNRKGWVSQAG